jgi:hypothetical protein
MKKKLTFQLICIVAVLALPFAVVSNANAVTTYLDDIPTTPTGSYRWLDVADQAYSEDYRSDYNYTEVIVEYPQASVEVVYDAIGNTFHGTLNATNLKPNFAYQLKLAGKPDIDAGANERIGLAGRWWQEEWDGTTWTNGQNLNNKGDGSSPNPNDDLYFVRRDIPDATSPTGLHYRYTGYLVFDYFITDQDGNATFEFKTNSSFHVLWKTEQRAWTASDGPLKTATFDVDPLLSPAYDTDYVEATVTIFGEWERLPVGGIFLQPGDYTAEIILTEESFHGSGIAGSWAAAMGASIDFSIVAKDVVSIITAKYKVKAQQLLVEATSSAQPDAALTLEGYGTMTFSGDDGTYIFDSKVGNLRKGATVTVTSSYGGLATAPVDFQ